MVGSSTNSSHRGRAPCARFLSSEFYRSHSISPGERVRNLHVSRAERATALPKSHLRSRPATWTAVDGDGKCGTYWVFEDRARRAGRRIPLKVIVLPARNGHSLPDPMFLVSPGGPGTTNSELGLGFGWNSWWRDDRDVVLVDLRGSSGSNRLDCAMPGSDDHPVGYLETLFPHDAIVRCRDELSKRADLTKYTTPLMIDDLDEVRTAMGYGKINVWAGSWGTRAVLFYLKLHPGSIRSAIIEGVAPPSLKNPLPHARAAQDGVDSLFAACGRQPDCHAAYPNLEGDLAAC